MNNASVVAPLSDTDKSLINAVQRDFPLCEDPFGEIAARLSLSRAQVLARLDALQAQGIFSRFGAVLNHQKLGSSLLAAMQVPNDRLDRVVEIVNGFEQVNHNYLREHRFNLWFVVTAPDEQQFQGVLQAIEHATGLPILPLPMQKAYHLDLAFELK